MIKIIERGTRQVRTCETCGCKFSFEAEDIETKKVVPASTGIISEKGFVLCPQCNSKVILIQTK